MDIICETDGLKRFRFFYVKKAFFVVGSKAKLPHTVYALHVVYKYSESCLV